MSCTFDLTSKFGSSRLKPLPQMLFIFVEYLEELVGAALAATLVPGFLARLNLVQNIVSQLFRCLMCDVRNAHTS